MNIPPSAAINIIIRNGKLNDIQSGYIQSIVRAAGIKKDDNYIKPKATATAVVGEFEIFIPLEGIIDLDSEIGRIEKEITRLEGALKGVDKKLANERFVNNAPAEIVEKERAKKKNWEDMLMKLKRNLKELD